MGSGDELARNEIWRKDQCTIGISIFEIKMYIRLSSGPGGFCKGHWKSGGKINRSPLENGNPVWYNARTQICRKRDLKTARTVGKNWDD